MHTSQQRVLTAVSSVMFTANRPTGMCQTFPVGTLKPPYPFIYRYMYMQFRNEWLLAGFVEIKCMS